MPAYCIQTGKQPLKLQYPLTLGIPLRSLSMAQKKPKKPRFVCIHAAPRTYVLSQQEKTPNPPKQNKSPIKQKQNTKPPIVFFSRKPMCKGELKQ